MERAQQHVLAHCRPLAEVAAVVLAVGTLVPAVCLRLLGPLQRAGTLAAAQRPGEEVRIILRGVGAAAYLTLVEDLLRPLPGRSVDDGVVVVPADRPLLGRVADAPPRPGLDDLAGAAGVILAV